MVDMTTYVSQSASRYGFSDAARQLLQQAYQSGKLQVIAQLVNDAPAGPPLGGTGIVLSSGDSINPASGNKFDNAITADAYRRAHPGTYTIDQTGAGTFLSKNTNVQTDITTVTAEINAKLLTLGELPLTETQVERGIKEPLWRLASTNAIQQATAIEKIFASNVDPWSVLTQNELPAVIEKFGD